MIRWGIMPEIAGLKKIHERDQGRMQQQAMSFQAPSVLIPLIHMKREQGDVFTPVFGEGTKNQKIKKRRKIFFKKADDKKLKSFDYRRRKKKQTRADNQQWENEAEKFIKNGGHPDELEN